MDALEELDFRLSELSVQRKPNESQKIAFYVRSTDNDQEAISSRDRILLFCVFMDPRLRKMEYLGSIEAGRDEGLYSVCFRNICALDERMRHIECSFFCVHPGDRITQIRIFQKTVEEVRLCP